MLKGIERRSQFLFSSLFSLNLEETQDGNALELSVICTSRKSCSKTYIN